MTMQKPKYCGQNWLDMKPANGGRICGHCSKLVVDFSKKSWKEIEQIQQQNNNAVCGMYNPKQLDYWGREIPTRKDTFLKAATVTALTTTLSLSAYAQTNTQPDSLIIKGKVIDEKTKEGIAFAAVGLKNNKCGVQADSDGNFMLVVKNIADTAMPDIMRIAYVGYQSQEIIFDDIKKIPTSPDNKLHKNGELSIELDNEGGGGISYAIPVVTRKQWVKWKWKHWFGSKAKFFRQQGGY